MQDIQGVQIASVEQIPLNSGKTMFKAKLGNGTEATTFDANLAGKAYQLVGQTVDVRVDFSQKNGKTYTNLKDVAPAGQLPAESAAAGTAIPFAGGSPGTTIPVAPPQQNGNGGGWSPEKEQRVSRWAAYGRAIDFVGRLYTGAGPEAIEEAWAKVVTYAEELFTRGHHGSQAIASQGLTGAPVASQGVAEAGTPIIPTASTPAEVAAQVDQVMSGAVTVGAPAGGF